MAKNNTPLDVTLPLSPRNTKGPPEGAEGGTHAWPRPWSIARFGGGGTANPVRYRNVTGTPGHHTLK